MRATTLAMALAFLAASLMGCAQAGKITGPEAKLPSGEESPGFLDRASSLKTISENDAMRGVLMLATGKDEAGGFQDRVAKLREMKIVDSTWDFDANRPVTRGKLAYMLYQALHMKGGVMLMVTGPSQRYCARELAYQGILASDRMTTQISGGEFVAVIGRADAYKQTGEVPEILRTSREGQ